jgi:hypothetical protein
MPQLVWILGPKLPEPGAVVAAPTFYRAFARWCLTVAGDRPRR